MKIYFDTNIIIDFYGGKYEEILNVIYKLKQEDSLELPFASTHIEELCDFEIADREKQKTEIKSRLDFVSTLSSNLYFCNDMVSTCFKTEPPAIVYDTLNFSPTKLDYKGFLAGLIPYDALRNCRAQLNLDPQYLNNVKPEDAIEEIDRFLFKAPETFAQTYSGERSVIGFLKTGLEMSENAHKGSSYHNVISKKESYVMENVIVALFSLLDSFGFWSDKKNGFSTGSLFGDAIHCFNASYCDYLISNDLRLCNKSLAVYKSLNLDTIVFHFEKNSTEIRKLLKIST